LAKSELVPVGNVPNVSELACILGCRVSSLPMKYLGLPLGTLFKSKFIWDSVFDKMEKRLVRWKRLCLSKDDRVR
jgi:hypothetical protein